MPTFLKTYPWAYPSNTPLSYDRDEEFQQWISEFWGYIDAREKDLIQQHVDNMRQSMIERTEEQIRLLWNIQRIPKTIRWLIARAEKLIRRIKETPDTDFAYSIWLSESPRHSFSSSVVSPSASYLFQDEQADISSLSTFTRQKTHYPILFLNQQFLRLKKDVSTISKRWLHAEKWSSQAVESEVVSPILQGGVATKASHESPENHSSRTPAYIEKIDRMSARVETILSRWALSRDHVKELWNILNRLDLYQANIDKIAGSIHELREKISETIQSHTKILWIEHHEKKGKHDIYDQWERTADSVTHTYFGPVHTEYLQILQDIRKTITHKDSSQKWGESVGDGSFVMQVWRPLLSLVINVIRSWAWNVESFSWSEIVEAIRSGYQGTLDSRINLLLWMLMENTDKKHWKENMFPLIHAVERYAETKHFHQRKGVRPLNNILPKLRQYTEQLMISHVPQNDAIGGEIPYTHRDEQEKAKHRR